MPLCTNCSKLNSEKTNKPANLEETSEVDEGLGINLYSGSLAEVSIQTRQPKAVKATPNGYCSTILCRCVLPFSCHRIQNITREPSQKYIGWAKMAAFSIGIKELVSKKKHRYKGEGFNLDLSYITDRLIAMGFPAQNFESLYRNSMDDVKRFLEEKHKDHFKIYNLCSERIYDTTKFHGRVAHFPFDDHHPPKFDDIKPFCEDVTKWLQKNQKNVAVVHCKAGKGRTGVMICCYLLHSKLCESAEESLEYYGRQRTQNEKGVTIPSQRRYINYYERMLKTPHLKYQPVYLYLRTLVLDPVPNFNTVPFGGAVDSCYLQFTVTQRLRPQPYVSEWYLIRRGDRQSCLEVDPPLLLREDVKIEFHVKPRVDIIKPKFMQSKKEFHFWLNTFFVDSEFGFSGMTGLAHQVFCGAGSLSPASTWPETAQMNSAPPTANINYVQTETPPFLMTRTNVLANELTEDKQQTCVIINSNRPSILKQQNAEEKVILEEQEHEEEKPTDSTLRLKTEFSEEKNIKCSGDTESKEKCQSSQDMQQEDIAPQLQSKVVIEEADKCKTENQLQSPSDASLVAESSLEHREGHQQDLLKPETSLHVGGEVQSESFENIHTLSPPGSPSDGECNTSNASIERKCSGGSDPGSTSGASATTIPVSPFHHHNIYSGTSPVDDRSEFHNKFFCNHKQCNNANALPERHVSGGFTAPPSRQTSDGTSTASTTTTGSMQAPDTPPVSAISTPSSVSGIATTHSMVTDTHTDSSSNLIKNAAYSDELLLREQQQQRLQCSVTFSENIPKSPEQDKSKDGDENLTNGNTTTVSFESNGISRTRHTSVPQTARSTTASNTHDMHGLASEGQDESAFRARQMALQHHASLLSDSDKNHTIHGTNMTINRSRVQIDGSKLSLRLCKSQIDSAAKSKKKVYQDNFSVTLFLVKPKDQSDNLQDLNYENADWNKIPTNQHEMLNSHPRLAPSGSAASVMSSDDSKSTTTSNGKQNHQNHLEAGTSTKHLRFRTGRNIPSGLKFGNSTVEINSSQESSSEDDLGSAELARTTNEDKTTKSILRKSGSSCSSTRVVAVSTKTKVNELEGNQTSTTNCSHQLMTSASEVMHSKATRIDGVDNLHTRRISDDRTVPPTDNADTSITGTNTATVASVTSDFVMVTFSDLQSAVSHTSNANNSPIVSSNSNTVTTTTPSTSVLHHHSHHTISSGASSANTIAVTSTWI